MQLMDVEGILARGKEVLGLQHDAELAEHLHVSRPTVAAWRRRKSIPVKYLSKMLDNGRISFDWLMTGDVKRENLNDYGFTYNKPAIDPYILWLALCKLHDRWEVSDDKHLERVAGYLSEDVLKALHIELDDWINRLSRSKEKWLASKVIREEDVYRALATEFDLTFLDLLPVPWWEADDDEESDPHL
jgi:transcriptional regulator with XRE-family HTH domain